MATTLLDSDSNVVRASFPILKWDEDPNDPGTVFVYGPATTPRVDTDEQIVESSFSGKALQEWLDTAPALRTQHNGSLPPAGSGVKVEINRDGDGAHWVKAAVDEPTAVRLVKKGHLRAFSVGIARPVIERDPTGKARGGVIKGGKIIEVSLVDSPANRDCFLEIAKAAKDGSMEFTGKMFGDSDILTKSDDTLTIDLQGTSVPSDEQIDDLVEKVGRRLVTKSSDTVPLDLPKDVSVSFSPTDLAKLLEHRRIAEERVVAGEVVEKRKMDPDVGGGVDRDKIPASDFAGRDRSFPIVTPGDVSDAASSMGRAGADNYSTDKLKENIIRIARRKGDAFVAELPESWKKELGIGGSKKSDEEAEVEKAKKKGKKAFPGAKEPFGPEDADGKDSDGDGKDIDEEAKPDMTKKPKKNKGMAVKKDKVMCPGCGANIDEKHNFCPECGNKVPSSAKPVEKNHDFTCLGCGKNLDDCEKYCPGCGKENPGYEGMNTKSHRPTPGEGVVGTGAASIEPVPAHREPDGGFVESFERDAHLEDGDHESEVGVMARMKSIGVPTAEGALHDLLCPAFHPHVASKAHSTYSLDTIDTGLWQQKALDAAVSAPMDEARAAAQLWQHALTLKKSDSQIIDELREEAYKSFKDANPGPGTFPSPSEISPTKFKRPFISEGHASPGKDYQGPHTHGIPGDHMEAEDHTRGALTAGHAADSPSNKSDTPIIAPAPVPPGMSRTYYRNAEREAARSAMKAMHDHIAQTFPDLCSMSGPGVGGEPADGSRPVPVPASMGKSDETAEVVKTEKSGKKSKKNKAIAEESRDEILTKAAATPDLIKSAVIEATSGLVEQLAELTKALKSERERTDKLQEIVDQLGELPDPRDAPFRGVAQNALVANKMATGLPAGARSIAESAEQAQQAALKAMHDQWRYDPDPAQREAAESYLYKMVGLPTQNK